MRNLMHHLNQHNLRQAFRALAGNKASGIDHVTKDVYQQNLEQNLQALEQALRGGGWRPKPAREVLIPKPQGGMRPLAIGCLEDKNTIKGDHSSALPDYKLAYELDPSLTNLTNYIEGLVKLNMLAEAMPLAEQAMKNPNLRSDDRKMLHGVLNS
jgi:hypothetical protein